MREIKFRAYCDSMVRHEMFDWDYLMFGYNLRALNAYPGLHIMQYTGLKDKNGVEIYEGDIVKGGWHKTAAIYEIRWYRGGFMLHEKGHFGFSDMERHDGDSKYLEVIGNIYENPELLEKS